MAGRWIRRTKMRANRRGPRYAFSLKTNEVAMSLSKIFRAHGRIGLAAALLAVASLGGAATADNVGGTAPVAGAVDPAAGEGAFRHLRALQDIATASKGNRAAGTVGYDRSAEYVAERLKEAGYVVRLEEFEFPFFEEHT